MSQTPQLSNARAQASICRRVTCFGSSTIAASRRASYHPLFQSAAASAWSLPIRFLIASSLPIGTPKARGATMP